jgi:hypothetical protein
MERQATSDRRRVRLSRLGRFVTLVEIGSGSDWQSWEAYVRLRTDTRGHGVHADR